MRHMAIIGGGAAGASVFGELLRRADHHTVIYWITGTATPGLGVAYSTADDDHLLNVRASDMALLADRPPDDFLCSARHRICAAQDHDFLPRRLFGECIQEQLRARMTEAEARGVRFSVFPVEATAMHRCAAARYRIERAGSDSLTVDAVVLALGALRPRPLPSVTAEARASAAYVLDPWQGISAIAAPRRVLVIGTGLTAVDVLLTATARWPQAEFVACTTGWFPSL